MGKNSPKLNKKRQSKAGYLNSKTVTFSKDSRTSKNYK